MTGLVKGEIRKLLTTQVWFWMLIVAMSLTVLGVVGTILGATVAGPRYYAPPPPVYVAPAPVYVAPPPPRCYWTRGEPVWDGYRGVWFRPRMQVCD